jgi:imidazolonepropionase-like amidohydrolase
MGIRQSLLLLTGFAIAAAAALAVTPPPDPAGPPLVIRGGTLYTVTHGVIENGAILIRDGLIREIGPAVAVPRDARVIEAAAAFVCPGFIDAGTNLGLVDLESVERDDDEATAPLTPQLRITDGFNPESALIGDVRRLGTTAALITPGRGNLLSGQSGLLVLDGGDVARMVLRFPAAVEGSLGEAIKPRSKQNRAYPYTRMGEAALLRQTLTDARAALDKTLAAEKKGGAPGAPAPRAESMLQALFPVLRGEAPLALTAHRFDDISTALRIAADYGVRLVVEGGAEAYRVKEKLAAQKAAVVLDPASAYRLAVETQGAIPENAALLQRAGVKIAFRSGSIRNLGALLPLVRAAVKNGLPPDEALKALTINPAEIFGVSDKLGSLEVGKRADIVLFAAHPLTADARVKAVIIGGNVVYQADGGRKETP